MPVFNTSKKVSPETPYYNITRSHKGEVTSCTKPNDYGCSGCIMRKYCEVKPEGE